MVDINTSIWVNDKESYDIGMRVIRWDEPEGISFLKNKKYTDTKCTTLAELQKKLTQFTVHWAAVYRAKHMQNGLDARGLSCSFMIDDDAITENGMQPYATIYQCLPLTKLGWSQGSDEQGRSFNGLGPGVEIAIQPQAWEEDMYDANDQKKWKVPTHEKTKGAVHGTTLTVYKPTEAQMRSLSSLIWGYSQLFPDIPMQFPRDNNGNYINTVLKDPFTYKGICNHLNLKRSKIDYCGLDLARIEEDVKEMKNDGYNKYRDVK